MQNTGSSYIYWEGDLADQPFCLSWRFNCVNPRPILITDGKHDDNDALSKTLFFSSMKSIDCSDFVNIFSNNIGVVRSKDLKDNENVKLSLTVSFCCFLKC